MYKVIKDFTDLRDNRHVYRVGEEYPHSDAINTDESRISELMGHDNFHGEPLIEFIPDDMPKPEVSEPKKRERKKNVRTDSGIHS